MLRSWRGRRGRIRLPRSAGSSADDSPSRIGPGREDCPRQGSPERSRQREERLEHPLEQRARLHRHRCLELHAGLQRNARAIRGHFLRLGFHRDPVHRLVLAVEAAQTRSLLTEIARAERRARNTGHDSLVLAELLKGERLITQQNALPGVHEADVTAPAEQMHLELRSGRDDAQKRHGSIRVGSRLGLKRRDDSVLGRGYDDTPPRLGERQFLIEGGDVALDLGKLRLLVERQIAQFGGGRGAIAFDGLALAFQREQPGRLCQAILFRLLDLRVDDEAALEQFLLLCRELSRQLRAFLLQDHLAFETVRRRPELLESLREIPAAFGVEPLLCLAVLDQALAPERQLPRDLFLGSANPSALQLARQLDEGITLLDRRSLLNMNPHHDARLRREDTQQALLWNQPAVDPRGPRVLAKDDQAEQAGRGNEGE